MFILSNLGERLVMSIPATRCLLCFFLALFLGGCREKSLVKTLPVTGVVSFQGQPLPNAVVTFYPESGRPASGITNSQGEFSLSTFGAQDGAVIGMHKATVSEPAPEMKEGDYSLPEEKPPRFPAKYTDPRQSGLQFEVKPDAENKITIELKE